MKMRALSGLLGAVLVASSAAAYPGSTIIWEGSAVITSASAACADDGIEAGERARVLYRLKVASTDPADAIEIIGPRAPFLAFAAGSSKSLNEPTSTSTAGINNGLVLFHDYAASADLKIASFTGGPLTAANNIRISGTFNDYFFTPGCTITIRASLTVDPH